MIIYCEQFKVVQTLKTLHIALFMCNTSYAVYLTSHFLKGMKEIEIDNINLIVLLFL